MHRPSFAVCARRRVYWWIGSVKKSNATPLELGTYSGSGPKEVLHIYIKVYYYYLTCYVGFYSWKVSNNVFCGCTHPKITPELRYVVLSVLEKIYTCWISISMALSLCCWLFVNLLRDCLARESCWPAAAAALGSNLLSPLMIDAGSDGGPMLLLRVLVKVVCESAFL